MWTWITIECKSEAGGQGWKKKKTIIEELLDGPLVKNLPFKRGYTGLVPDEGNKIPHVSRKLLAWKL